MRQLKGIMDTRFKGISVTHDLTPLQRGKVKQVYQEAKQLLESERANSVTDDSAIGPNDLGNARIMVVGQMNNPRAVILRGNRT